MHSGAVKVLLRQYVSFCTSMQEEEVRAQEEEEEVCPLLSFSLSRALSHSGAVTVLLRQYVSFCTSKASKVSTCARS